MSPLASVYPAAPRLSGATIAIVAAAHVAVLALLTSLKAAPLPTPLTTLTVHLVAAPPAAEISPPRPHIPAAPSRVENKPTARPKPLPAAPARQAQLAAQSAVSDAIAEAAPSSATAAPAAAASAASATSAHASTTISAPRFDAAYLSNPAPAYPPLSRKLREEGRVVLRVLVDANGRAIRIEINNRSGWPRLDQAAQDAVARWKFVAARRGDEAVDAWVLVPIVFNLRN